MRIWWVNAHAVLPEQGGGTRHFDISRELVLRGHDVTVWAMSQSHGTGKEVRQHEGWQPLIEEVDGVRWVWLKTTPYYGNGIRRAINMVSFFCSFLYAAMFATQGKLRRPEVIVGSSVHPLAPAATLCLSRLWGLPAVSEIRDIWPAALLHLGFPWYHPGIMFFALIERAIYRFSDSIITLLPNSPDHIVAKGGRRNRIYWVPNGTRMERVERSETGNSTFRAMYLGTFGEGYALETLIKAAAILESKERAIQIVLKGQGPHKAALEALISEMNVSPENLALEGPIPKTEVADTLAACDALIFHLPPSPVFQWGISSNKLFDYLASGRPVIFACNASNNPVEASDAGLTITPESPVELAEALIELDELPEAELLAMGRRGQAFIAENHCIKGLAKKFEHALVETRANHRKG